MTESVFFCAGCNEKFAASVEDPSCPQCGQTLRIPQDVTTQDYFDLEARGTYAPVGGGSAARDDAWVGRHLGTYLIDAFLGKGGMARVYRAKHLMLERPCAIKVLNPELAARSPDYIDMFLSEARAAAALVHPHVVTIHTIGRDEGLHYIEMEYVLGQSLQSVVDAQRWLEPLHATHLMVQICSALAEAHHRSIVHRDVKPANVLLTESGAAKLADFGLAKRIVTSHRTPTGHALQGTPYYMAPELFDGKAADPRSDVYAAGVTFFQLLTGRLPFVDQSFTDLAIKHAMDPIPEVQRIRPEVSDEAASVVRRCLAKDPRDRFADAAEMHTELKAVYGAQRSLESLMREAFAGLDIEWHGADEHFVVRVSLAGGRSQTVYVQTSPGMALAQRVVKIFSVCAPAVEGYYRRALEINAVIPHGSIALECIDGRPHFVMGNTYPRATCDPQEIRDSLLTIAQHADGVERCLTAEDKN
jgi:serine/threonine-protein kinase